MISASRRNRTGGDHGFTLIELMIVLSLIVLLAGMGLAQYRNSVTAAKEATLREDLFRMRDLLDQYYADKQQYAPSLESLVTEGYMRKIPVDPFTGNADSWQIVQADPDPSNPTADPGIADLKSGAEGTALDGSKYGDW
jgi:general secretion pathway protein G